MKRIHLLLIGLILTAACQKAPYLTVDITSVSFTQDGGNQVVTVSANNAWTATVSGTGFNVSPKSGEGDARIAVSAAAATSPDPSTGTVTITSEGLSVTIELKQDAANVIMVSPGMRIPTEGGTFSVDVQYNTDMTVEIEDSAKSWITFNGTRALTSGKLEFTFKENDTAQSRSGNVTVKDKAGKAAPVTLTFEQDERKMINVDDPAEIPAEGGSYFVKVNYNTDFTVEVEPDAQSWITFLQTRALTSGSIFFSVAENHNPEPRTALVSITDKNGKLDPLTITLTQAKESNLMCMQRVSVDFYEALGARNWNTAWVPGANYPGLFIYDNGSGNGSDMTFAMDLVGLGVEGEIPECIGDFGTSIKKIRIAEEPGITGKLPDSFSKLTDLEYLDIRRTSMTEIGEVFSGMKQLKEIYVVQNKQMTGPLPASLGEATSLKRISISENNITGSIPESWSSLSGALINLYDNELTGVIPPALCSPDGPSGRQAIFNSLYGNHFDISNTEIPGYRFWVEGDVETIDGKVFTFEDVIKENKYTVYLLWAPWCPFSKVLVPELRDYYEHYRQDGLEVIATVQAHSDGALWIDYDGQRDEILTKGYDKWYNFYYTKFITSSYLSFVPAAEVYDQNGNILFSAFSKYEDPVRNRFDKIASTDLMPFLESLLGPAIPPDNYESTDFSEDGKVMTLQKATVGKGIDIVFMGDAYTDRDMGSGGLYETVMAQAMEEFFAEEPYKTFRNRFNVYAVKVVSKNARIGEGCETALNCYFGNGTYIGCNNDKCFEYALRVPEINSRENLLIAVMANTTRTSGTAWLMMSDQSAVAIASSIGNDKDAFGDLIRHEAGGHGFAFLADEYYEYSTTPPAEHISGYNSLYENYGWYSNVDFTDDPAKIRWKAFLSDDRYKGAVGIYEGAALYSKGAWRPSQISIMKDNYGGYNAPSRWAIYQQIMKRSGETPTFEAFLQYDEVNRKSGGGIRIPMKAAANRHIVHGAPPVIVR